jgi:Fur family transcriptional regulator, peroxide stress response regulator
MISIAPAGKQEIRQRMDPFRASLKRNGVKLTPQRMIIFQKVAESEEHPNAESVYRAVRKKLPMVSLDTVYRTLWLLQDLGLIRNLGGKDRARFDGNMKPHHHFVCNECGWMRDFYNNELDQLKIPKEVRNWGNGETVHIEIRGVCRACLKKSVVKSKKISQ